MMDDKKNYPIPVKLSERGILEHENMFVDTKQFNRGRLYLLEVLDKKYFYLSNFIDFLYFEKGDFNLDIRTNDVFINPITGIKKIVVSSSMEDNEIVFKDEFLDEQETLSLSEFIKIYCWYPYFLFKIDEKFSAYMYYLYYATTEDEKSNYILSLEEKNNYHLYLNLNQDEEV